MMRRNHCIQSAKNILNKLSTMVKLYNVKARNKIIDKGFIEILQVFMDMLPNENELSLSMY